MNVEPLNINASGYIVMSTKNSPTKIITSCLGARSPNLTHCHDPRVHTQRKNGELSRKEKPASKTLLTAVPLIIATLLTITVSTAWSDDIEIYNSSTVKPNILFVLDASGSMGQTDGFTESRLDRMKVALDELLSNLQGMDVGLMRFSIPRGGGPEVELIHPVVDIEANRQSLLDTASAIPLGRGAANGTPTVAALYEAQRYFQGATPYRGVVPAGTTRYQSPTNSQCDSNHIVVLTDGRPTPDSQAVSDLSPIVGPCAGGVNDRGTCGIELAQNLSSNDQLSHVPGLNTLTTHSIGFNIRNDWIVDLATEGRGQYRDAASSDELVAAFNGIVNSVQQASSAAAPATSVTSANETRHSDELYYTLFQPATTARWEGNVKKYRLRNGVIVDANDNPILENGTLAPTTRSLWSATTDGFRIGAGGMAARQVADRNWYTDAGLQPNNNGITTPLKVIAPSDVSAAALNAADNAERDRLVNWVRGADSIDLDSDTNTTEPNFYVADSIHSSPLFLSYFAPASSAPRKDVVFVASNMGVLHAVDADTGEGLWSYTPEELLPNIKEYVDNTSPSHVYGLDGQMMIHTTENVSGNINAKTIDDAWLYLTQRRGGSNLFALDVSNALQANDPFKVMWKIKGGEPGSDFRDIAQTWSAPQMVSIRTGCPGACALRNALLFSGGYNDLYDNTALTYPVTPPSHGHGNAIYLVDPATGELLWSAGNGAHHSLNLPIDDSIPATPVPVDTDADGAVNILFFSDIAGHVWRVDLDPNTENTGDLAIAGGRIASLNQTGQSLRFFNKIDVVTDGSTAGVASFRLVLGSGMRSSPLFEEPDPNRVFVLRDPWMFTNPTRIDPATGDREPDYNYVRRNNGSASVITPAELQDIDVPSTPGALNHGFFRNLARGEKVLQSTLSTRAQVLLTTYLPPDANQLANLCGFNIGTSQLYIFDIISGENSLSQNRDRIVIGSGIVPASTILDTGDPGGPDLITGTGSSKLDILFQQPSNSSFRRMYRTGWLEK